MEMRPPLPLNALRPMSIEFAPPRARSTAVTRAA